MLPESVVADVGSLATARVVAGSPVAGSDSPDDVAVEPVALDADEPAVETGLDAVAAAPAVVRSLVLELVLSARDEVDDEPEAEDPAPDVARVLLVVVVVVLGRGRAGGRVLGG